MIIEAIKALKWHISCFVSIDSGLHQGSLPMIWFYIEFWLFSICEMITSMKSVLNKRDKKAIEEQSFLEQHLQWPRIPMSLLLAPWPPSSLGRGKGTIPYLYLRESFTFTPQCLPRILSKEKGYVRVSIHFIFYMLNIK